VGQIRVSKSSVDREVVGRNISERQNSPEIDRDRSSRPYPANGEGKIPEHVEFGRFAQKHAGKRGRKRPETIYFLGFSVLQKCTDKEVDMA